MLLGIDPECLESVHTCGSEAPRCLKRFIMRSTAAPAVESIEPPQLPRTSNDLASPGEDPHIPLSRSPSGSFVLACLRAATAVATGCSDADMSLLHTLSGARSASWGLPADAGAEGCCVSAASAAALLAATSAALARPARPPVHLPAEWQATGLRHTAVVHAAALWCVRPGSTASRSMAASVMHGSVPTGEHVRAWSDAAYTIVTLATGAAPPLLLRPSTREPSRRTGVVKPPLQGDSTWSDCPEEVLQAAGGLPFASSACVRDDAGTGTLGIADVDVKLRELRVRHDAVCSWCSVQQLALAHLRSTSQGRGCSTGDAGMSNVAYGGFLAASHAAGGPCTAAHAYVLDCREDDADADAERAPWPHSRGAALAAELGLALASMSLPDDPPFDAA